MSVRLDVFVLLAIVTHVAVASAADPPRIARGGEAWLQDDLADGKSRDKFSPATRNTGHLHVKAEDDGGESALIYTWKAVDGAPGPVTFTPNGSNAARDTKFTYRVPGWYTLEVTVTDEAGLSTASRMEIYLDDFSCYEDAAGRRIWYSLMRPQDPDGYDADKKYPLVIDFHGGSPRGERHNNHSEGVWIQPEAQRQQPYFYVSPGCPAKSAEGKPYQNWLDRDFYLGSAPMPDPVTEPVRLALEMLDDIVKRYPVDERRLVITGASNGGYATWDIICRHPDKFMAAIPVCGGGDPLSAARLVNVPIWATHGDRDPYVPVKGSRNMIRYLRQAGGFPRYTEIAGAGHNVWGQAWSNDEVRPWAFDETPPTAVKNLAAKVVRGRDVRLTWQAAEDADCWIACYRILRNGKLVGTTESTSFTDEALGESRQFQYKVVAANGKLLTGLAVSASVTTPADTLPPAVDRVIAVGNPTGMKVVFSEQVNRDDARNADNYRIAGVTVRSASLAEDDRTVTLVTSPLSSDAVPTKHLLRVAGVRDTAASPRTTDAGLAFEFTSDPRLVAWWKLDDKDGERVTDASGNGHHGKVKGNVQWTRGRIGGAIQLDGKDGFVELGDILNDVNFPVTMSAWLKYDGPPIEKDRLAPIFFSDDIRDARRWAGFWLALYEGVRPGGGFGTTQLWQHRKAIANQPVRLDTWTHLAVTIASPNDIHVFVNGRAVEADQSRPYDVSRISPWDDFPPRKWDNIPARIGRRQIREEPGAVFFTGSIDDVRVYSRALSGTEILGIFTAAD